MSVLKLIGRRATISQEGVLNPHARAWNGSGHAIPSSSEGSG